MNKELYQKQIYTENELDYYLDECYFHPSRNKEYSSAAMKRFARCAMQLLWDIEGLNHFGEWYDSQDIRKTMIEEMMPEDLDMATSVFRDQPMTLSSVAQLAFLIFFIVVNRDVIIDELFRRTYPQPAAKKEFIPHPNCRRRFVHFQSKAM